MTAWFYALALIPVAEVTAIGFLAPLFGTLGAIVFLGEKVRIRRWTALMDGIQQQYVIWWRKRFTDALFAQTVPAL